jgi:hypothetical protein
LAWKGVGSYEMEELAIKHVVYSRRSIKPVAIRPNSLDNLILSLLSIELLSWPVCTNIL